MSLGQGSRAPLRFQTRNRSGGMENLEPVNKKNFSLWISSVFGLNLPGPSIIDGVLVLPS